MFLGTMSSAPLLLIPSALVTKKQNPYLPVLSKNKDWIFRSSCPNLSLQNLNIDT